MINRLTGINLQLTAELDKIRNPFLGLPNEYGCGKSHATLTSSSKSSSNLPNAFNKDDKHVIVMIKPVG